MTDNLAREIRDRLPSSFEPVMELAGELALARHEGRPINYAFLVGTDSVWPGVAEVLSADFGVPDGNVFDDESLNDPRLQIKLIKTVCESNYSIFQIFGAAGFFNTGSNQFVNIIRLRQPSEEELSNSENVTDLDDLFCFCLNKIYEVAKGDKACIVSTEGDGKVRIYAAEERGCDLLFIWDVNKRDIYRPVPSEVKFEVIEFLGDNNQSKALLKVMRKVSTTVGEGAMLILEKNQQRSIENVYLAPMEYLQPEWQKNLNLTVPKELLRAAFIMDGATLIIKESETKIKTRYTVYPFNNNKAFSILRDLPNLFNQVNNKRMAVIKLTGKGSKTHGAANLSYLLNGKIKIITISADGPIKIWPNELKNDLI
jgi:hypothetical protein